MKTTVEIADALLAAARRVAAREHTTVRALIEQGLRIVLDERKRPGGFRLRRVTFAGRGLQPSTAGRRWEDVRDAAYEGRGG